MNLYEILEVNENASEETINKIYKMQAKRYHPDLQHTDQEKQMAEEKMKKINEAYGILSNPQKRNEYDENLRNQRERVEAENRQKIFDQAIRENQNNINNINQQDNYVQNPNVINNIPNQKQYTEKDYERDMKKQFRKAKFKFYKNTFIKRIIVIFSVILILIFIYFFPPTHKYLVKLYNDNIIIKYGVDILVYIFKFFKNIIKEMF